jgi:HAD superfamily hydrolase (TIGR01509 family)
MNKQQRWVVFDLIGVLAEPSWREISAEQNLEKWREFSTGKESEASFWDDTSASAYRAALRFRADRFRYLLRLKDAGVKICLATNFSVAWLDELLTKVAHPDLFDAKVVSASIGAVKPNNEFWSEVLKHVPKGSIFVDDQKTNCDAARVAGLQSIWAYPGRDLEADLDNLLQETSGLVHANQLSPNVV